MDLFDAIEFMALQSVRAMAEKICKNIEIKEKQCFIDCIEIKISKGGESGCQLSVNAYGLQYELGEVKDYEYSSYDKTLEEFCADIKEIPLCPNGELYILDELIPLDIKTEIQVASALSTIFKGMEHLNNFCNEIEKEQYLMIKQIYLEQYAAQDNGMGGI